MRILRTARTRRSRFDQAGQAMTEYVVILSLAVLGLIVVLMPLRVAIGNYLRGIYFVVGLPIP
jgi:Flp pilus assembly pilin Flp